MQRRFSLPPFPRGFHLITDLVLEQMPEIGDTRAGLLNLFIQHTSASLTLNENASPDVRRDFVHDFAVALQAPCRDRSLQFG